MDVSFYLFNFELKLVQGCTFNTNDQRTVRFLVVLYPGYFVPKSFRTLFGHFVPNFGQFVHINNHFVSRLFRIHFRNYQTGYKMTRWCFIRIQVISYPF